MKTGTTRIASDNDHHRRRKGANVISSYFLDANQNARVNPSLSAASAWKTITNTPATEHAGNGTHRQRNTPATEHTGNGTRRQRNTPASGHQTSRQHRPITPEDDPDAERRKMG
jgi:hypothetical protein